jgi:hypothetical protein
MIAPNSTRQLGAVARRNTIRFSRDYAHCGREDCRVAAPAFKSPLFGADGKDLRNISSRQQRKAEARHSN